MARWWEGGAVVTAEQWGSIRAGLCFGQRLQGRVVHVPQPGGIGVFVDVGLPVGGLVDVLLLPRDPERWPTVGTESEFEVWRVDDRMQIRLLPAETRYVREDFAEFLARWRPGWPQERGMPVLAQG